MLLVELDSAVLRTTAERLHRPTHQENSAALRR